MFDCKRKGWREGRRDGERKRERESDMSRVHSNVSSVRKYNIVCFVYIYCSKTWLRCVCEARGQKNSQTGQHRFAKTALSLATGQQVASTAHFRRKTASCAGPWTRSDLIFLQVCILLQLLGVFKHSITSLPIREGECACSAP